MRSWPWPRLFRAASPAPTVSPPPPSAWDDPDTWLVPTWCTQARDKKLRVADHLTDAVRRRQRTLEAEFRRAVLHVRHIGRERPEESDRAKYVHARLQEARCLLDASDPDALRATEALDLAEQVLIELGPDDLTARRWLQLPALVNALPPAEREQFGKELAELVTREPALRGNLTALPPAAAEEVRVLCAAVSVAAAESFREQRVRSDVQITRLGGVRRAGYVSLAALLMTTPLLAKWPPGEGEEVFSLHALRLQVGLEGAAGAVYRFPLSLTIATIGVALFGAAGGFLSALLQVHGSRVAAAEYRESKHTLLLRPIIGAVIALILFILLSWNVVPGVTITGTGTYLLLAMLSGFSERYFLRLLDLDDDAAGRRDTKAPAGNGAAGK